MRYNELLDTLQNLIDFKPTYKQLGTILGIGGSAIGNRAKRNADFSDEEIKKIEHQYGIKIKEEHLPEQIIEIDYYKQAADLKDNKKVENFKKILLPKKLIPNCSNSAKYYIVDAFGEDMSPNIKIGDRLIIECTDDKQIEANKIYLFDYEDQIFAKRLVKNMDELVIISDNPNKEIYANHKLHSDKLEKISILGKIVGLLRKF